MTDEKFADLAEKTGEKDEGERYMINIKTGMEAKGHALCCEFCNQRNTQNPFGSEKYS